MRPIRQNLISVRRPDEGTGGEEKMELRGGGLENTFDRARGVSLPPIHSWGKNYYERLKSSPRMKGQGKGDSVRPEQR